MSELLESFSAGILPSFTPSFLFFNFFFIFFPPLDLSAPISLLQCQTRPLTSQNIAGALFLFPCGSLSPACTLSHHFLPLSVSLFPISILFPLHVFKASQKSKQMTHTRWPMAHSYSSRLSVTVLYFFPLVLYSLPLLSVLFPCPHCRVLLTLRSQNEMPPILLGKLCFITFPSHYLLRCRRQVVVAHCKGWPDVP